MRHGLILFLLFVVCFSSACDAPAPKSYVTPEVRFNKRSAEMGTPVEMTYSFATREDFSGFRKNLTVFVHFLDPKGVIRFVDDHLPPVRTNQWMPSKKYSYERSIFVPENIPTGEYTVELGVYLPEGKGERIELNAKKITPRSYDVGKLEIRRPEDSEVRYVEGWYEEERDPSEDFYHWRWTKKKAVVEVPNPKTNALLYLRADSDPAQFSEPQRVTIRVNGSVVDEFAISGNEEFVKKYPIAKETLGSAPTVPLELSVSQIFVPASTGTSQDNRELGIRVFVFYLGSS